MKAFNSAIVSSLDCQEYDSAETTLDELDEAISDWKSILPSWDSIDEFSASDRKALRQAQAEKHQKNKMRKLMMKQMKKEEALT